MLVVQDFICSRKRLPPTIFPEPHASRLRAMCAQVENAAPEAQTDLFRHHFAEALSWPDCEMRQLIWAKNECPKWPDGVYQRLLDFFIAVAHRSGVTERCGGLKQLDALIEQAELDLSARVLEGVR